MHGDFITHPTISPHCSFNAVLFPTFRGTFAKDGQFFVSCLFAAYSNISIKHFSTNQRQNLLQSQSVRAMDGMVVVLGDDVWREWDVWRLIELYRFLAKCSEKHRLHQTGKTPTQRKFFFLFLFAPISSIGQELITLENPIVSSIRAQFSNTQLFSEWPERNETKTLLTSKAAFLSGSMLQKRQMNTQAIMFHCSLKHPFLAHGGYTPLLVVVLGTRHYGMAFVIVKRWFRNEIGEIIFTNTRRHRVCMRVYTWCSFTSTVYIFLPFLFDKCAFSWCSSSVYNTFHLKLFLGNLESRGRGVVVVLEEAPVHSSTFFQY